MSLRGTHVRVQSGAQNETDWLDMAVDELIHDAEGRIFYTFLSREKLS